MSALPSGGVPLNLADKRARVAKLLADARGPRTFPLSSAQERLWFLEQLTPGGAAYNVAQAYRVKGALDVPALERSLSAIVHRHASLRTTFAAEEGHARQILNEGVSVRLAVRRRVCI